MTEPLAVAVAVISDRHGAVLISHRHAHRHQGNRWEFPGGKIEPGETVTQALAREIAEELGVQVLASEPLIRIPWYYADRAVVLNVQRVTDYAGIPHGQEGQPLRWVMPDALRVDWFPAANRPIVHALQLPAHYVISPDADDPASWLAGLDAVLARGERLLQFRVRAAPAEREALAAEALARCRRVGATLLLNGDPALARRLQAGGVHLPAACLGQSRQRPLPAGQWVGASCHTPAELAAAARLGADFAVLSPVAPTASHPQAAPLGWPCFARWVAQAPLPVYALGGMQPGDAAQARELGGQGVAGIRGFWP